MANVKTQKPTIWKKRILVPFWVVRIILMTFILVAYGWTLRHVNSVEDATKPAIATVVLFMLFIIIVLLLDLLAIVLFLRDALKPGPFLWMNAFQTAFWLGVLIMGLTRLGDDGGSPAGIGFSVFVFITFLSLLIYSAIGYKRAKRDAALGKYAPANQPAPSSSFPAAHPTPYTGPSPYEQTSVDTAYPRTPDAIQLQNQPLYHTTSGSGGELCGQQPVKPANMV